MNDQFILNYYARIAESFGLRADSTIQDHAIRSMEMEFACAEISNFIRTHEFPPRILELGCGNGTLLQEISRRYPHCKLWGVEFSPELTALAQSRNLPNCQVDVGDMRLLDSYPKQVDMIITERSLINLASWDQQRTALGHMMKTLSFPGRLVLMESFAEPWIELNQARKELALSPIPQSPQNIYLKEKAARLIVHYGFFERKTEIPKNALSTHFYLSRVFHAGVKPDGSKTKFSRLVEFFDQGLPTGLGNYSPILLRSFEKTLNK